MINKDYLVENIKTLFYALVIALLIRSFLIQPFYIPSSSMEPNLLVGDRIFVTKYSYGYSKHSFPFSPPILDKRIMFTSPKRGDVIVFKTPADNRTDYIKRLIGLPGDKIQFRSLARPRVLDAIQVLVHVPTVDAEQSVLPLLDHPSRRVSRHLVARRTALIEPFARLPHPQHLDRSIRRLHVRPKRLRILADQILLVAVVLLKARVSRARHRVSMRLQTLLRLLSLRRVDRRDRRAQQKKMSHALPRARRPRALARESHRQQVSQRRRVDARARELFDRPEHRVARRSRRRARVAGRRRRHRVDRRDRASSASRRRRRGPRAMV